MVTFGLLWLLLGYYGYCRENGYYWVLPLRQFKKFDNCESIVIDSFIHRFSEIAR